MLRTDFNRVELGPEDVSLLVRCVSIGSIKGSSYNNNVFMEAKVMYVVTTLAWNHLFL